MGRYYSGDIEGKFWFAVQSSNDASFFGGEESEPNYLNYYFDKDDLPKIKKGLETCYKELGKYKKLFDKFFEKNTSYNDKMLTDELEIPKTKIKRVIEWYARAELGEKIKKCVVKTGECNFEAEL